MKQQKERIESIGKSHAYEYSVTNQYDNKKTTT